MTFDPSKHISDAPHVTDGPIVVSEDGDILSGHDRHKEITQAYKSGDGNRYKLMLINHSPRFGIDPMQVMRMKRPVLVRKIKNNDLPHK